MPDDSLSQGTPQFATAEYAGAPDDLCKTCGQKLTGPYYRINGALACSQCTQEFQRRLPKDSHAAYVRGLTFGSGGAVLGLFLYSAFAIITGLVIGYVSLAVGYIVGKAILMGSRGIGGRRYQIAAVLLTYAAVSVAAVPIGVSLYLRDPARAQPSVQGQPSGADTPSPESIAGTSHAVAAEGQDASEDSSFGGALLSLLLLGLVSPFLELGDPLQGLIGLVILAIGMRIAWQQTSRPAVDVLGPFDKTPSPSV